MDAAENDNNEIFVEKNFGNKSYVMEGTTSAEAPSSKMIAASEPIDQLKADFCTFFEVSLSPPTIVIFCNVLKIEVLPLVET